MSYKLIGQRNLRKYSAPRLSPTYAAAVDAQIIVDSLCGVPWEKVAAKDAIMTYHTEESVAEVDGEKIGGLEMNVRIRDQFDAALFCADHAGGQHRAYANAAVYHYVLPDGALPKLTRLVVKVTSDPYNAAGARIAILTNATGEIPTKCSECRTGDAHADGVAPRTVASNGNWFPTMADCVFSATPAAGEVALPSGGLQLQKHLFVFVLMESYSTVRGNWLEGCSFIENLVAIETTDAIPGWTDVQVVDLSRGGASFEVQGCKDGGLPDYASQAPAVRSLAVYSDGTWFAHHEKTISPIDGGFYSAYAGILSKIKGIDAGKITCVCQFPVTYIFKIDSSHQVTMERMFVAVGGTFEGGTFQEIDGLYLFSVESLSLLEGLTLGTAVPSWMKSAALINDGFAVVMSSAVCVDPSSPSTYNPKMNSFSCVFKNGRGVTMASDQFGLTPVFYFGFKDTRDERSFVASAARSDQYPSLGLLFPNTLRVVSAAPFNSWFSGAVNHSERERRTCMMLVEDSGEYSIAFAWYNFTRTSSGYQNWQASVRQFALNEMGISGTPESAFPLGIVSSPSGTNYAYVAKVVITGDLVVNGKKSICAVVDFDCAMESSSSPYFGYENFSSVTIPEWASLIVPDIAEGLSIRQAYNPDYALDGMTPIGQAIVCGNFSSLGGEEHERVAILDINNSKLVSTNRVFKSLSPSLAFAFGEMVLAAQAKGDERVVDCYDERRPQEVTDDQAVVGLRTLLLDFAGEKASPVDTTLTGRARVGAGFSVRKSTTQFLVEVDGSLETRTAEVWRLTSAAMALSFPLPTEFVARAVRMSWPESSATPGATFSVWIREGAVDDVPDVSDMRLYDSKGQSVVNGWRLLGIIDACTTDRQAVLDLGNIRGRSATILLTAYASPDLLNPSAATEYPIGAATSMDADMIGKVVSGLGDGWKPDITLIG